MRPPRSFGPILASCLLVAALAAEDAPTPAPAEAKPAEAKPADAKPDAAAAPAPAPSAWQGVWAPAAGALAKEKWGTNGIGALVVCASGDAIAAIDGAGLWSSADGGATWKRLGTQEKAAAERPSRILLDPDHPATWWLAAGGSPAAFITTDGGATIKRLGTIDNLVDLAVDFSDAKRELLLASVRGKERGLEKSIHGGGAWGKAGGKLPDKTDPPEHPLILDAKTWLVATGSEQKDHSAGIFRTEDAGASWRKSYAKGCVGAPLRLDKNTLVWASAAGDGLLKTTDTGRTWNIVAGPARAAPIELPKKWLAALGESRVVVSSDRGRSWSLVGPELPTKADGLAYSQTAHCFLAFHDGATAAPDAILRMEVPEDLATVARPPVTRKAMLWDGDDIPSGTGFTSPKEAPNALAVQHDVARFGYGALLFRAKNLNWSHCGWSWDRATAPKVDATVCKKLVFSLKVDGAQKPTSGTILLAADKWVPILTYCPEAFDGDWHDVVIPFEDVSDGKLDPTAIAGFQLRFGSATDLDFSAYVDEVGFTDE